MIEQKLNKTVNYNLNTFVSMVKYAVEELGLSYGYLARVLGVERATIYYWVKGLHKPSYATAAKCYMVLLDLIEANTYRPPEASDFSLNHMGPPDNMFSFKASDDPFMRKVLGLLTLYDGLLGINNKVLLDTAAYYVRCYIGENRIKRSEAGMLALAALKVSMLRFGYDRTISHLIEDPEVFKKFFVELSLKYLSGLREVM